MPQKKEEQKNHCTLSCLVSILLWSKNYQYWDLTILNLSTQMRLFCETRKIHCKLVSESAVLISLSIHIFSILLASFSPRSRSIRLNYWCIIKTIRFQYFGWKWNYIIRKLKFKALSKSFYENVGFVLLGNLFYVFKWTFLWGKYFEFEWKKFTKGLKSNRDVGIGL